MADFGLSENTISIIKDVFKKYPNLELVKIFGSRAKGNYNYNSDIDFVIWGELDFIIVGNLCLDLDELPTPYNFDVKHYDEINNLKLKDHIDRVAKIFYKKDKP